MIILDSPIKDKCAPAKYFTPGAGNIEETNAERGGARKGRMFCSAESCRAGIEPERTQRIAVSLWKRIDRVRLFVGVTSLPATASRCIMELRRTNPIYKSNLQKRKKHFHAWEGMSKRMMRLGLEPRRIAPPGNC